MARVRRRAAPSARCGTSKVNIVRMRKKLKKPTSPPILQKFRDFNRDFGISLLISRDFGISVKISRISAKISEISGFRGRFWISQGISGFRLRFQLKCTRFQQTPRQEACPRPPRFLDLERRRFSKIATLIFERTL